MRYKTVVMGFLVALLILNSPVFGDELVLHVTDANPDNAWLKSNTSETWANLLNTVDGDTNYGYGTTPNTLLIMNMTDTNSSGNITNVTVLGTCKLSVASASEGGDIQLRIGTTDYAGAIGTEAWTISYANYTDYWGSDPSDTNPWEWSDIAGLISNVKAIKVGAATKDLEWRCTYTEIKISYDAFPGWSQNGTSVKSEKKYLPNKDYQFNVTWTDDFGISDVILEFGGTNYSYLTGEVSNSSNIYYKTLTDLAAGSYNYKWYANDSIDQWTSSDSWTYVINKATSIIKLYLNGTQAEGNYPSGVTLNFTVDLLIYNSANEVANQGFEIERTGEPLKAENWFISEGAHNDTDEGPWNTSIYNRSDNSYNETKSLATDFNTSVCDYYIKSKTVTIDRGSEYTVEFYTKADLTAALPPDDRYAMNMEIMSYNSSDPCYWCAIDDWRFLWNNTQFWKSAEDHTPPATVTIDSEDVGSGWYREKITIPVFTFDDTTDIFALYFGAVDEECPSTHYSGSIWADEAGIYETDARRLQTVYLDTNITGWTQQSGTPPLVNVTTITTDGKYNITGWYPGDQNYTSHSTTWYATVG